MKRIKGKTRDPDSLARGRRPTNHGQTGRAQPRMRATADPETRSRAGLQKVRKERDNITRRKRRERKRKKKRGEGGEREADWSFESAQRRRTRVPLPQPRPGLICLSSLSIAFLILHSPSLASHYFLVVFLTFFWWIYKGFVGQ